MYCPPALLLCMWLCGTITAARPKQHGDNGTWTTLAPLPTPRQEHSVAALSDRIYVVGGILSNTSYSADDPPIEPQQLFSSIETTGSVQYYDLAKSAWFNAAPLPNAINHGNIASVRRKLYLLGGLSGANLSTWNAVGDSFVYDPECNTWEALPSMPAGTARGMTQLKLVPPYTQASVATVTSFNIVTKTWTTSYPPIPGARDHVAGGTLGHKFYVTGGRDMNQFNWKNDTWALDVSNPKKGWTEKAPMPVARGGLSYATIGRKLYTFGGEGDPEDPVNEVFPNVESYDMLTDTWKELDPMLLPKHGVGAAVVDGMVYIPGGGVRISAAPTSEFEAFTVYSKGSHGTENWSYLHEGSGVEA